MSVDKNITFNFPQISGGYVGIPPSNSALGGLFYGDLFSDKSLNLSKELLLFPQRVPVIGFFDELIHSESASFKEAFNQLRFKYLNELKTIISNPMKDSDFIKICNILDLCARLGLLEEIASLAERTLFPADECWTLVKLKLETYSNTYRHSIGKEVQLHQLFKIASLTQTPILKALSLARILVTESRYDSGSEHYINKNLIEEIYHLISHFTPSSNLEKLWCSMVYRALPMGQWMSEEMAWEMMDQSIKWAQSIQPKTNREEIVKKELLLTTYLSISKLYMIYKDDENMEKTLLDILNIDMHDALIYTDLGFFYFKRKKHEESLKHFLTAIYLGPPAYAMNCFYAAKCYLELGSLDQALKYLNLSAEIDPLNISARLELIKIYFDIKKHEERTNLARHILSNSDLKCQLDQDELRLVSNATHV